MWMVVHRFAAAVVLSVLACGAAQAQPNGDESLMPPDGFLGAIKKAGPAKVFTSSDLYGFIDGGAEAFLELGFEQLTVQRYRDGASTVSVELYRMTDPAAARGIYLARCGKETPDPLLKDRHTAGRSQVLLQRDRYYLVVNTMAGGDAAAPLLPRAALAVASKLPPDGPVTALALLPRTGLNPASARLFRGPVGLQTVYSLGDGDILQLNGTLTAAAGDYTDATLGPHTLIVAEYPTPAAATAALANVKARLDPYLKAKSATAAKLVFEDYEKKFGVVTVTGKRLEIRIHLAKPPA
jgi:hypothetical protein